MSTTFDIGCLDCRKRLWIGQRDYVYSTPEHLQRLSSFLLEHKGHRLTVATEHMIALDDCEYVYNPDTDEKLV